MKLLQQTLILVMALGLLLGVMWHHKGQRAQAANEQSTQQAVTLLQRQVLLQSGLTARTSTDRAYPTTLDPTWFEPSVPQNQLLEGARPWLEVAPESDREFMHPRSLLASSPEDAGFWYNPWKGVVRARVPADMSDEAAINLYNLVNGTNLSDLFFNQ